MTNINFGSTYKIPVTQWGINNTKKVQLKNLISAHNGLVTKGKDSYALVSILDKKDLNFIRRLREIGYYSFEKYEGEKIPKDSLELHIKNARKF